MGEDYTRPADDPDDVSSSSSETDLLILCLGSRGDVQPWLNLALYMARERASVCVVAAHPEYGPMVERAAAAAAAADDDASDNAAAAPAQSRRRGRVLYAPLGGSMIDAMRDTPAGRALREARSLKAALEAADAFFSPLAAVWARDCRALCRRFRPRLVLHSTFTFFCAFAAPFAAASDLAKAHRGGGNHNKSYVPRVAVAHTVPSHITRAFLPPTTGAGFVLPLAGRLFLHRLAWRLGFAGANRAVYVPVTRAAAEVLLRPPEEAEAEAEEEGQEEKEGGAPPPPASPPAPASPPRPALPHPLPTWRDAELLAPTPTFYVWSPSLVPRPDDWPANAVVVGAQLTPEQEREGEGEQQEAAAAAAAPPPTAAALEAAGVPLELASALLAARRQGRPVVFATLGSMLGTVLEGGQAQGVLEALVRGAGEAAAGAAAEAAAAATARPSSSSSARAPPPPPVPLVVVHATTGKRDGEDSASHVSAAAAGTPAGKEVSGAGDGAGDGAQERRPGVGFDLGRLLEVAREANAKAAAAAGRAAAQQEEKQGGSGSNTDADGADGARPSVPAVLLLTRPVPHGALLPLCDLALHHCGAGTTHAAVAAAVPSLPLPAAHASDQPWWRGVLQARGCAPARCPLPALAADLTPRAFARAVREALEGFGGGGGGADGSGCNSPGRHAEPYASLKRAAERAGRAVRAERGTARFADELERVMRGPPAAPPPAPWSF